MGPIEPNPLRVGIDVGEIHDPTAFSVAEAVEHHTGKYRYITPTPSYIDPQTRAWIQGKDADPLMETRYIIRTIKRIPLNTSYPNVAIYFADMLCKDVFINRNVKVLIDVTGVGRPVYEALQVEISRRKEVSYRRMAMLLKPISFVHGELYNRTKGTLGKAFLVSNMQKMLQWDRIDAPDTPEMQATLDELRVYEVNISQNGTDTYGAKIGKHDDLATALGLSVLEDPFADKASLSERWY